MIITKSTTGMFTIARVEHHLTVFVLVLAVKVEQGQSRPHFLLKRPCIEPVSGDKLKVGEKSAILHSGGQEISLLRTGCIEMDVEEETHGHA